MFETLSSYFNFREGFGALLNAGTAEAPTAAATTAASDATQTQGGVVKSHIINVRRPEMAMKVSAWFAGVRILSENAATLMLKYQRWNDAQKCYVDCEDNVDKRLWYILTVRPNRRMNRFQFYKNLYARRINEGNAFVFVTFGVDGKPYEQYLLTPGSVWYNAQSDVYTVDDEVNRIRGTYTSNGHVSGTDGVLLHFKDFCYDGGYWGMPRIWYAATQLGIASTAANETLEGFGKHGVGKYIYHDRADSANFTAMTDTQMADNVKDIQEQLDEGADIIISRGQGQMEAMQMDAVSQQFLAREEFNNEQISRFLAVPLSKINMKGDQTYKSLDAANINLYSEGIRPLLEDTMGEYNAKLIPWTLATTYRYWYDCSPLYISDLITEADYIGKCVGNGTMTVNEARYRKNLPPVEGGDITLVSANLKTPEQLLKEGNNPTPTNNNFNNNDK